MLSDAQKHALIDLARRSIDAQVTGSSQPVPVAADLPEASGVFVTIRRRGELRGCLGTLQCDRGLAGEVARCAADAASACESGPQGQARKAVGHNFSPNECAKSKNLRPQRQ